MKLFCPGCTTRRLEMNAAPCAICGRENPVTAPQTRQKLHPIARLMHALLSPLGRLFHFLTLIFCAFALWSMALHGVTPFLGVGQLGLAFSGFLVILIWSVRLLTRAAVYCFVPATRQFPRPGLKSFLPLPICLAVLAVLNHFNVPLKAAFWPQINALEQVANLRFVPGGKTPLPKRVGIYQVDSFQTSGKNVRFEVTDSDFLWSGTKAGFAKCPNGCQNAEFPPVYLRSEEPEYIQLSKNWFWWEEAGSDD